MNGLHLIDLLSGVGIPVGLFLLFLTAPKWLPIVRAGAGRFVNRYAYDTMSSWEDEEDDEEEDEPPVRPARAPDRAVGFEACDSPRTTRTPEGASALLTVLEMAPDESAVIRKMVYYRDREIKLGNTPGKAATILAATGLKKSGDPKSNYAKWAAIYDALFGEPEPAVKYPARMAQQREPVF